MCGNLICASILLDLPAFCGYICVLLRHLRSWKKIYAFKLKWCTTSCFWYCLSCLHSLYRIKFYPLALPRACLSVAASHLIQIRPESCTQWIELFSKLISSFATLSAIWMWCNNNFYLFNRAVSSELSECMWYKLPMHLSRAVHGRLHESQQCLRVPSV